MRRTQRILFSIIGDFIILIVMAVFDDNWPSLLIPMRASPVDDGFLKFLKLKIVSEVLIG